MRRYQVIQVVDDDYGYAVQHMEFSSYEEAEEYAKEQAERAEEEYGTIVDYDTNVFATLENHFEDWRGFIEIIELDID